MTEHIVTAWILTYAVHGAIFTALAAAAERTCWGAVASRRDAFWKLALVGGILTSTVFVAAGSAPAGAAVHLSPQGVIAPALTSDGVFWLATGWMAITAILALRTARAWRLGLRHAGRRHVIRRGPAPVLLQEILGPAADRVTLSCSRTLGVPVAFAREICVPIRALRELPDDELRALLAHEAAHVVRRDAVSDHRRRCSRAGMVAAAQSRRRGAAAAGHGVVLRRAGGRGTARTRRAGAVPDQSRRMERSR